MHILDLRDVLKQIFLVALLLFFLAATDSKNVVRGVMGRYGALYLNYVHKMVSVYVSWEIWTFFNFSKSYLTLFFKKKKSYHTSNSK